MRVAPAAEKSFRQGNQGLGGQGRLRRIHQDRICETVLHPHRGGTGENKSASRGPVSEQRVISGILNEQAAEVGLGAKKTGGNPALNRRVTAASALQIVVPPVAHKKKIGRSYASWLRQKRNQVVGDFHVGRLYPPVTESVGHRRQFALLDLVQNLRDLQRPFQPLRSKRGDVDGVVVKRGGGKTKIVPVQQFGHVETDEPSLLQ